MRPCSRVAQLVREAEPVQPMFSLANNQFQTSLSAATIHSLIPCRPRARHTPPLSPPVLVLATAGRTPPDTLLHSPAARPPRCVDDTTTPWLPTRCCLRLRVVSSAVLVGRKRGGWWGGEMRLRAGVRVRARVRAGAPAWGRAQAMTCRRRALLYMIVRCHLVLVSQELTGGTALLMSVRCPH